MREERFGRAEAVLGEWLTQRDAGRAVSFTILVAQHAGLAPELRELAAGLSIVDQVLADGRQLVAEKRAAIAQLLAGLGSGKDFGERYAIEGEVGKGGMGAVFRVLDRRLGRSLAMKVIIGQADASRTGKTPEVSTHELQRFLNEARITGELKHPGIVPVHDLGVDAHGRAFFTMQLVNGRTLGDVLKLQAEGNPDWSRERVLQVIQRVCEAMAYAHERGIVHRDLKPQNIMVSEFGGAYVMDWGVARRVGDAQEPVGKAAAAAADQALTEKIQLTRDGAVVGTPAYMPPEQAAGRLAELGPEADVYALGAMLYQSIAGHAPYCRDGEASNGSDVIRRLLQGPPSPLPKNGAPPQLIAICKRAMAHDWQLRYRSVGELAEELGAFLDGRVVKAYEVGAMAELKTWVLRNKALASALGTVVLTLAVGFTFVSYQNRALHAANVAIQERSAELETVIKFHASQLSAIDVPLMGVRLQRSLLAAAKPELRPLVAKGVEGVSFVSLAVGMLHENVLGRALKAIDSDFGGLPLVRAQLLATLGDTMLHIGSVRSQGAEISQLVAAAVTAYRSAAEIYGRASNAQAMARMHHGLGNALLEQAWRTKGEESNRILTEASRVYRSALEVRTREQSPQEWAATQCSLGTALSRLGESAAGEAGNQLLAEAVRTYRSALEVCTRELHPQDWAALQNNLGAALSCQASRTEVEAAAHLHAEAVRAYRSALEFYTHATHPQDWAAIQTGLGAALAAWGQTFDEVGHIAEAVGAHRSALEFYTRENYPQDWARTQNNLGSALMSQGMVSDTAAGITLLAEAERAFRSALEVLTPDHLPQDWAMTQNNLGSALENQATRTDGRAGEQLLAEAVGAYRSALTVCTRDKFPQDWATTQYNLGNAIGLQAAHTDGQAAAQLLGEAVRAYRSVLEVCTRDQLPQDWARAQYHLGGALRQQAHHSESAASSPLFAASIRAYRSALEVVTRESIPQAWLALHDELGIALQEWSYALQGQHAITPDTERSTLEEQMEDIRQQLSAHAAEQNKPNEEPRK
jgi:tetratricopeptide (TPR) repeat protein